MLPNGIVWLIAGLGSYLIGAVPTAYIAARKLKGQDIRQLGDRNPGAANVYRNIGSKAGIAVGVLDIAKGSVAVLLARLLVDSSPTEMIVGVAVIAGHTWPVHFRLKGGRGAATAVGVLLAMMPALAIPIALLGLVVLFLTKNPMKALGFFFICLPLLAFWPAHYSSPTAIFSLGIPLMVGCNHYSSVRRESKSDSGGEPAVPQD